jgi:hypothetical protein
VLADYYANRQSANAAQVEDSVLATAMLATVRDQNSVLNWIGTATDFLDEVGTEAGKKVTPSAGWPKSPRRLMDELRRLAAVAQPRMIR